jgi:hypothetical protein
MSNVIKLTTQTLPHDELKRELIVRIELLQTIVDTMDIDGCETRGRLEFDGRKGASHEHIENGVAYGIFGRLTIDYSFNYCRTLIIDNPR